MGAKDWIADKSNFTFAQKMLVNADEPEFIMLEDVGHVIVYRRPDLLKNLLLKRELK